MDESELRNIESVSITAARGPFWSRDSETADWKLRVGELHPERYCHEGCGGWLLVSGERGRYQPKKCFFFGTASRMRRNFEFRKNSAFLNPSRRSCPPFLPSHAFPVLPIPLSRSRFTSSAFHIYHFLHLSYMRAFKNYSINISSIIEKYINHHVKSTMSIYFHQQTSIDILNVCFSSPK